MNKEQAIKFLEEMAEDYMTTLSELGHKTAAKTLLFNVRASFDTLRSDTSNRPVPQTEAPENANASHT